LVGYARLVDGTDRVAAADDRSRCLVGRNRTGNSVGSLGEVREFEDAGGAIPDDGAGAGDDVFDRRDRFGADVEALPVGGKVLRGVPRLCLGFVDEAV